MYTIQYSMGQGLWTIVGNMVDERNAPYMLSTSVHFKKGHGNRKRHNILNVDGKNSLC